MADTTKRDMVPTGLPYGERQKRVEEMRQAGVPVSSEGARPAVAAPGPGDMGGVPDVDDDFRGFDALQVLEPTQPMGAPTPATRARGGDIVAVMELSPNPVARAVARRLRGS